MRCHANAQRTDEDVSAPSIPALEEARASLARSKADYEAGRVIEGEVMLTKLRSMIAEAARRPVRLDP